MCLDRRMLDLNVDFTKHPVVTAYMQSNERYRFILGPFGSGKTVGSLVDVVRRASMQAPSTAGGMRKSRWAIVRNTVPELRETTMKSWFDWFPSGSLGYYMSTTKTYHIKAGGVDAEVIFCALDDDQDVKKLLGMELTGANLAEFREIPRGIVEALDGRIGRYPRMNEGGPSWVGMWGDSNMPEIGSYWERMFEGFDPDTPKEKKPNTYRLFLQPPAMLRHHDGTYTLNPLAENLGNLPAGYYDKLIENKADDFIRTYVMCEYGRSKGGKAVHPLFNRDLHVSKRPLVADPASLLLIAADFGLTPAIVIKQQNAFGQVLTFDSIATFGMGLERAIEEKLLPILRNKYEDFERFVTGDPTGDTGSQGDETSCADVFRRYKRKGLGNVKLAWSNNPIHRQGATDHFLSRIIDGGRPMWMCDPGCDELIAAMAGGFRFKIFKDGRQTSEVEKNDDSHVGEANEYGDMYYERGGRRKAEHKERQRAVVESVNHYASPR